MDGLQAVNFNPVANSLILAAENLRQAHAGLEPILGCFEVSDTHTLRLVTEMIGHCAEYIQALATHGS